MQRATVYFVLSGVGLIGTWTFNILFFTSGGTDYVGGWFANYAASSAAMDLLVVAVVASIVMVVEGARLGWSRWAWVFIPLSLAIALAFAFPLFLGLRELTLARAERPHRSAHPALARDAGRKCRVRPLAHRTGSAVTS